MPEQEPELEPPKEGNPELPKIRRPGAGASKNRAAPHYCLWVRISMEEADSNHEVKIKEITAKPEPEG